MIAWEHLVVHDHLGPIVRAEAPRRKRGRHRKPGAGTGRAVMRGAARLLPRYTLGYLRWGIT